MPRPTEELPKTKTWWERKTTQERILFLVAIISIIIIIALLFLIAHKQATAIDKICNTNTCLTESSKIAEYINADANPCDDFYQFACGSFLKNAHGDESLALPNLIAAQAKREILETYMEPINDSEHEMVIFSKKLFRACMNESEIEKDDLTTIKEVIRDLGGWPVVEGVGWNEKNFDWIVTTFKLRQHGYPFSVFLDLTVDLHPRNFSRYIFKIGTPELWDYSTRNFDKIQLMSELAEKFGAQDKNKALEEMTKAYDFLTKLQLEIHNTYTLGAPNAYTIQQYQKQSPSVNWLRFIQTLVGSTVNISEEDEVVFPPPQTLNSWLYLISKTPKRTQANYVIWKVIEKTLLYLNDDLRSYGLSHRSKETRSEFCLREIQARLIPSPIDILCDRKHLPEDRKQKVEELVNNIKSEFIESVDNIDWMDTKEKQKSLNIAKTVRVIIGQPQDYFNDQILDALNADMKEVEKVTFLNLLASANKNRQTILFNQTKISPIDNVYDKWYVKSSAGLPVYSGDDNVLYIPTTSINFLYNQDRPNYLNYGALGTYLGSLLSVIVTKYMPITEYNRYHEKFTSKTKKGGEENVKCFKKLAMVYGEDLDGSKSNFAVQQHIGGVISYKAYQEWAKINGEEKELIGSDYPPNQLYWISQALVYCVPSNNYGPMLKQSFSGLISASVGNNDAFAKDFECDKETKMNPSTRCSLI